MANSSRSSSPSNEHNPYHNNEDPFNEEPFQGLPAASRGVAHAPIAHGQAQPHPAGSAQAPQYLPAEAYPGNYIHGPMVSALTAPGSSSSSYSAIRYSPAQTPLQTQDQSPFGPNMPENATRIVGNSTPGSTTASVPDPHALNFGGLSLGDGPATVEPARPKHRESYYDVASSSLCSFFQTVSPNDVIIIYDKGKVMAKFDQNILCSQSKWFCKAIEGPFMESYTRCVRLRNDFPYGIKAMLDFFSMGYYSFMPEMISRFPNITLLDLHVHAYIVADKYDVPALGEYAMKQFLSMGSDIMAMDFTHDNPDVYDEEPHPQNEHGTPTTPSVHEDKTATPRHAHIEGPYHPADQSPAAEIDRFLNALCLLWKNTASSSDPMRKQALKLVKAGIHKLMKLELFGVMFTNLEGFGDDVKNSVSEDGFEVSVQKLDRVGGVVAPLNFA